MEYPRLIDEREALSMLDKAKMYLKFDETKKEARHELAKWILYRRAVVTEPITEKMFVYDEKKGHYRKTGETMLKADIIAVIDKEANNYLINEVLGQVKAMSYSDIDDLNATTQPNLIPLANCVYDLQKKDITFHTPSYFFTYTHPVNYEPEATCPEIDRFLQDVVANDRDREILLDIAALCFYRERVTRKFFILTGSGHNGKSKYIDIIKALIGGDRCVSVTPQHLAENDFAPSLLFDKHVNLGADIPGGKIDDASVIKGVTGGDSITVQKKGKDHFDIKPYCEFVYSSNDPPRFNENTYALWDRLVVVNFPYTFTDNPKQPNEKLADKEIEKKILTPTELSGFLNKILDRLPLLLERRNLSVDVNPVDVQREYQQITNTPEAFLNECCKQVDYVPGGYAQPSQGWVSKHELYLSYSKWCRERKLKVESNKWFGRLLLGVPGWAIEEGRETVSDGKIESYRGITQNYQTLQAYHSPILSTTSHCRQQNSVFDRPKGPEVSESWADFLDNQNGGTAPVDEFIAVLAGSCPSISYEDLKSRGEVYEPRAGFVRRIL